MPTPPTSRPGTTPPGTSRPGTSRPDTTPPRTTQPPTTPPDTSRPDTTPPGTTPPAAGRPDTTPPGTTRPAAGRPGKPDQPQNPQIPQVPLPTLLAQAKDLTIEQLHQRLHDEGFESVRFRHGSVFRFIDPHGSRLTALAERSGLSKQALAEIVDELQRTGYLERTADPADRRAKLIRLTPQGQAAQQAAARILTDIEHTWTRHLGPDTITQLRHTLEQIITRPDE